MIAPVPQTLSESALNSPTPMPAPDFLQGGSEMARRIAAYDWSATSLGAIDEWPQSLKTTLSIVINSRFPNYLLWGPDLLGFPNDAYLPVLGKKDALARPFQETWAEIWAQIRPIAERALAGEPSFFENLPIDMERFGYLERTYFTFCYSPIRDESGAVGGMLVTCIETTATLLAEQHQQFQLKLADGTRGLAAPAEITAWTCRVLGEQLKVRRVGYATVDAEWVHVNLPGWHDGSVAGVVGEKFPLASFGPELVAQLHAGDTVRLDNVGIDPRSAGTPAIYGHLAVKAMLIVPIVKKEQLIAVVAIGSAVPRRWSDAEATLAEEVAERTRSAVERAIAEDALKRQLQTERDRLSSLFERAPAFMTVLRGPDHTFELVNAAYRRLMGGREVVGTTVAESIPEAVEQGFVGLLDNVYATGEAQVVTGASLLLRAGPADDEVQRYIDFVYQPLLEPDGTVSGIFVVGSDTTQTQLASEALLEATRRKDDFLAMLAHELRNPLAPISTAAQLLQLTAGDPQRVKQAGTIISRQVTHMTSLVDDLLDVSRVTRGLITLQREQLDLDAVVSHAVEQARPFIEARRHVLTVQAARERVCVHGDSTRLVQVIVNLLNNAAKYTPDGGAISLALQSDGDVARVLVTDTGNGVDASLLPHVFELFTQGTRTPDRSHGGLGLGLSLVRSLVELHGGHVSARSPGVGLGSTFEVTLPQARASVVMSPGPPAARPLMTQPRRVMVVDDNQDAGQTIATLLEAHGHHVTVCADAASALAAGGLDPPDVFILDIGLPGMDGHALAATLRAQPAHAGALFIALTGYGGAADRAKSGVAGFTHHFVKPVDAQRLLQALGDSRAGMRTD